MVVERDVDVGQTVAASLQAPQLFLIANDLSHLQILASVDESDIGQIREGQQVRFSGQAYPDQKFPGKVQQVRLQSKTQDNVVNYTVVVAVDNPQGKLLPGMTATIDFLTGAAHAVLLVPNAALRFRPTQEMLATLAARRNGTVQTPDGARRWQNGERSPADGNAGRRNGASVWYLDADGKPQRTRVTVGITDGQRTQIDSPKLQQGMQVIVGSLQGEAAPAGSSPFQAQPQTGRRPPGVF